MVMDEKTFYAFEDSVRKACQFIIPTDVRKVVCGNMLIEAVKSMHLKKTENSRWFIIPINEYFSGSMKETSKYGYRDYVPDICIVEIEREEIFKDKIIGYLDRCYHA